MRRAERVGGLAEGDQRRAGVRADDPADVEVAERALPRVARRRVGAQDARRRRRSGARPRARARKSRDRLGRRLRRLERDRVPDVRQLDEPSRSGARAASSRPCSGRVRSSSPPTTTSTGWPTSPRRPESGSAPRDRAALADVVGRVVFEQQVRGTRRGSRRRAASDGSANGGFFDQKSVDPRLEPHALDPLRGGQHARRQVGEVGLAADQHERTDTVRPLERELERDRRRRASGPTTDRSLEPEAARARLPRSAAHRSSESSPRSSSRERPAPRRSTRTSVCPSERVATRFQSAPERPEPVDEHDRRPVALHLDVELCPVDDKPAASTIVASVPSVSVHLHHPSAERRRRRRSPAPTARRPPRATG